MKELKKDHKKVLKFLDYGFGYNYEQVFDYFIDEGDYDVDTAEVLQELKKLGLVEVKTLFNEDNNLIVGKGFVLTMKGRDLKKSLVK